MTKTIQPRTPDLDLTADIPRHWFGGNALATHLVNGVNLLFPAGERFFVRSVRHYLDKLEDDPAQPAIIVNELGVGYRLMGVAN